MKNKSKGGGEGVGGGVLIVIVMEKLSSFFSNSFPTDVFFLH